MIIENSFVNQPKISLIITYYNLGKYICDCVSSILNQTYKNYEIIIVNDCSNDENFKIFNNINGEKIKKISLKQNSGQLLAFIEGLKIAQGEFVCMVDADDILLPNYLETLLYIHLNNKAALVSSSYGEINQNSEVTFFQNNSAEIIKYDDIKNLFDNKNEFKIVKNKLPYALWGWNPSTSAMFRKSALDILKYFPDKKYWMTGADKVVFSLLHLVGGSINTDAVLYLYRHHDLNNSQTSLIQGEKKYLNEEYVKKLVNWNIKLRVDTVKMFIKNKKKLIEKYNKLNYLKMFLRVIFCIDKKVCAKIIKTFAHKLLFF